MSIEDLRRLGVLVENGETEVEPASRVDLRWFVASGLLGLASCVVMALGNGGVWTWIGLGVFLASLGVFIKVNFAGAARSAAGLAPTSNGAMEEPDTRPDDAPSPS